MRMTTARMLGLSRWWRSSRTMSSVSAISPSRSTTATRGPKKGPPPSPPRPIDVPNTRNSAATPMNTSTVATTTVSRRPIYLFLVVVVVLPALPALALAARATAGVLRFRRRSNRVGQLLQAEPDAPLVRIDADDQERELVTDVDHLGRGADRTVRHLRDVQQAIDTGLELYKSAEVCQADDLPSDPRPHGISLRHRRPRIRLDLLEPQRDTLVLPVEIQDLRVDVLALLQHLRRMPDVAGPRHIGDVEQPVDAGLQLDEGAEIGEVADLARHAGARLVTLLDGGPRIRLHLLHAERDALGRAVHVEDDHVDLVADVDELRGMAHAPRPRHLGDVHEPFHPRLELDEGTVVGEAHHAPAGLGPRRKARLHRFPRVVRLLLVAQRDTAALAVEVEDDHLHLVTDLKDL